jgi:hypothetical protein
MWPSSAGEGTQQQQVPLPAGDLSPIHPVRERLQRECVMNRFLICMLAVSALIGLISMTACAADLEIEIKVTPSALVIDSEGTLVTVHTNIAYSAVDTASLTLNGIPIAWTKSDARGQLVAKFNQSDVKAIVAPPSVFLVLSGLTKDGTSFSGSDTIVVK